MTETAHKLQGKAGEFARILREQLPELGERYQVKSLGLFGSCVRGEEREGSDLDVLVEFTGTPDLFEFVALGRHLSELLGVKVDLVMKRALKPRIGERILKEVVAV
jgi:predicted nucleotidyltransferase